HTVQTRDGGMPAHLWLPHTPGEPARPGIVVLQEIFGVSDYIRSRCADLAAMGYAVLAPEIYWRLEDSDIDESREDFLERSMEVVGRLDWDLAVADATAALEQLGHLPTVSRVGLMGFCFGGGLAF